MRELCSLELLTQENGVVRLTRRGVLFSNEVFARFLETGPELQCERADDRAGPNPLASDRDRLAQ